MVKKMMTALVAVMFVQSVAPGAEEMPKSTGEAAKAQIKEAKEALRTYATKSKTTLDTLTRLLQKGRANDSGKKTWVGLCEGVRDCLEDQHLKATGYYIRAWDKYYEGWPRDWKTKNRPKGLPEKQMKWLRQENAQWLRIETFGVQAVVLHDKIVDHIQLIRVVLIPNYRRKMTEFRNYAKMGDASLALLTKGVTGTMVADMNKTIRRVSRGRNSGALSLLLDATQRECKEILAFRKSNDYRKYKEMVKKFEDGKIDLDQKGTFLEYEKKWERSLKEYYNEYEQAYTQYSRLTSPLLTSTMFNDYAYLRGKTSEWLRKQKKLLDAVVARRDKLLKEKNP